MPIKLTQNPIPEINMKQTVAQKMKYSYFTAKELSEFSGVCERMNNDEDEYHKKHSTKPTQVNLTNAGSEI